MTVHRFMTAEGVIPAYSRAATDFLNKLDSLGASGDDARGILATLLVRMWIEPLTRRELHDGLDHIWRVVHGESRPSA